MRNIRKFLSVVRKSINYDTMESSTRIQGYLIIVLIYIMTLIFCSMELTSFINSVFIIHEYYKISNEKLTILTKKAQTEVWALLIVLPIIFNKIFIHHPNIFIPFSMVNLHAFIRVSL